MVEWEQQSASGVHQYIKTELKQLGENWVEICGWQGARRCRGRRRG